MQEQRWGERAIEAGQRRREEGRDQGQGRVSGSKCKGAGEQVRTQQRSPKGEGGEGTAG